nr:DNA excision repair protein ERCC-1 [Cryptococcus depauperatus CBS 7841]
MEEDKPPSTKDHSEHSMPPPASVNTTSIHSTAQSSTRPLSPPRPSTDPDQTAAQPRPIHRPAAGKHSIIYNSRRNPVLACIRNVSIEIGDIPADYQVGTHNGVLFLSVKYHRLHPEYIHQRIEKMKNMYHLRIILVLCDVTQHQQSLRELTKIAIVNGFTLFVAWSNDEVAQYLVTFKQFEHKSADSLKERVQQTYHDQLQHVLTSGKKVNKTDADHLAAEFGSFEAISRKSAKVLSNVKGLGATKVTSLVDGFTKPFLVGGLRATASRDVAASLPRETTDDPIDEKSPPAKRVCR